MIIHDRLATKSFDVLDVLRADDANYLQAGVHRELNRIRLKRVGLLGLACILVLATAGYGYYRRMGERAPDR